MTPIMTLNNVFFMKTIYNNIIHVIIVTSSLFSFYLSAALTIFQLNSLTIFKLNSFNRMKIVHNISIFESVTIFQQVIHIGLMGVKYSTSISASK